LISVNGVNHFRAIAFPRINTLRFNAAEISRVFLRPFIAFYFTQINEHIIFHYLLLRFIISYYYRIIKSIIILIILESEAWEEKCNDRYLIRVIFNSQTRKPSFSRILASAKPRLPFHLISCEVDSPLDLDQT